MRAVGAFCAWLENHGIPSIAAVGSIRVAAYVEDLGSRHSALTIKQLLAAIRMMFDWLAIAGSSLSKADCHSPAFIRFPP